MPVFPPCTVSADLQRIPVSGAQSSKYKANPVHPVTNLKRTFRGGMGAIHKAIKLKIIGNLEINRTMEIPQRIRID